MGHQDGQEIQIQQELIREGEQHRLHIILISHIEESENTSHRIIDQCNIAQISKFNYLTDMVQKKLNVVT